MTTVVTGTFDGTTGEFNFAYAAHPRMLLWRQHEHKFLEIGDGLENLPIGFVTGEMYNEQSVRLQPGDMILAFSDGATESRSPGDEQLTPEGLLHLAETTIGKLRSSSAPPRLLRRVAGRLACPPWRGRVRRRRHPTYPSPRTAESAHLRLEISDGITSRSAPPALADEPRNIHPGWPAFPLLPVAHPYRARQPLH